MARKDALLRLHERLVAKRDSLRKKFTGEGLNLSPSQARKGTGDTGDAAYAGSQTELNSQLAALESRELAQIEQAILLMRDGKYGKCEHCGCSIPIARLKALPYTPYCVACQHCRIGHRIVACSSSPTRPGHEWRRRTSPIANGVSCGF